MIREIISAVLIRQKMTTNHLGTMAAVNKPCLYRFLAGENTLGIKALENIFRSLSVNVVDEDGAFFYYGHDLRTAIVRGIQHRKMLIRELCERAGITQPNLTAYLKGRSTSRPSTVENLLVALNLGLAQIEPTAPPKIAEHKTRCTPPFLIGVAIQNSLDARGMSAYHFAKSHGLSTGNFAHFLKTGKALGSGTAERIMAALGVKISGTAEYVAGDIRSAVLAEMQAQGKTAVSLADKAGCSGGMVSVWLKRKANISVLRLEKIIKALGLRFEVVTS